MTTLAVAVREFAEDVRDATTVTTPAVAVAKLVESVRVAWLEEEPAAAVVETTPPPVAPESVDSARIDDTPEQKPSKLLTVATSLRSNVLK